MDKKKVIRKLQDALEDAEEDGKIYAEIRRPVLFEVIDLLKEQEHMGIALTNVVELMHKKDEQIEKLLKLQEAVEPILDSFLHKRCPSCRTLLKGKYCHECGQAVKWE